jgi:hypothetical protein
VNNECEGGGELLGLVEEKEKGNQRKGEME